MNGCGVVFVAAFGDRPDLDRYERCTRWPCDEHTRQLNWVRDAGLLLAYTEQVRRFQAMGATRTAIDQEALLP